MPEVTITQTITLQAPDEATYVQLVAYADSVGSDVFAHRTDDAINKQITVVSDARPITLPEPT